MNINRLECRERTIRASHDGTEIVRTFYVDPYEAHTVVLSALLGAVEPDPNDATKYIRRKPAEDSWFDNFYCTDAWVEQVDQQAMAASPSLGVYPPGNYSASQLRGFISNVGLGLTHREEPTGITRARLDVNDAQSTSDAGCFIRASFKPLIHETPTTWTSGDTGTATAPDAFDFVDPLLIPLTKIVSPGIGMKYTLVDRILYANVGSEGFVTQPMHQFTIRRLMIGKPPLMTIGKLKGKINSSDMTLGNFLFPAKTLRFDDCEVVKRAVPYSDGTEDRLTVWYDLLYIFTWNSIYDYYYDDLGEFQLDYVTWNRILGVPQMPILGLPIFIPDPVGGLEFAPLSYYPVGWKPTMKIGDYRGLYLEDTNTDDYKGGSPHGFYDLFNPAFVY